MTRLPAGPLLDLIRRRATEAGIPRRAFVVERFGESVERQFWRWTNGLGLRPEVADELACALGVHPGDLWAEWWDIDYPDDSHGTLVRYQDGCACLPCVRAGLDDLTERMWAMSPLTREQLEVIHAGGEPDEPTLHLVPSAPIDRCDPESEVA